MTPYEISADVKTRALSVKIYGKIVPGFNSGMATFFCIFVVNPGKVLTHDFLMGQMRRLGYTATISSNSTLFSHITTVLRAHKADLWFVRAHGEGYKFRPPEATEMQKGSSGSKKSGWRSTPLTKVA